MEDFFTPWSNKRAAGLQSPHHIGLWSHCSTPPGSLPLGPCWVPASHWIQALPGSVPLRPHQAPALHRIHTHWDPCPSGTLPFRPWLAAAPHRTTRTMTCQDPHPSGPTGSPPHRDPRLSGRAAVLCEIAASPTSPGSPLLGPNQAPTLQACQINTLPGSCSGRHWRAPNLPKRHRQTGLDAKEVTSEQIRLQVYCSRIGDLFFFPSLRVWLSGLVFDHPPSLPFFHFFLFFLSFIFPSISLFSPSLLVLLVLIL
jgi:hypothetical protein